MYNFYNQYDPWDTEEERRKKQAQNSSNNMSPRDQIEQAWDNSAAAQAVKNVEEQKDMEATKNMSTRDTLDYFMKKQEAENLRSTTDEANFGTAPYIPVPEHKPRYAELDFDGKTLDWVENGQVKKTWPAMSGRNDYQAKKYTDLKNYGPIPEGKWHVNQNSLQNFDDLSTKDKIISGIGGITKKIGMPLGKWPGTEFAWGKHRIPLQPDTSTNTQGRTNVFLHGGSSLGSAGCVDLAKNMDDFLDEYKKYGRDMLLNVFYPNNRW